MANIPIIQQFSGLYSRNDPAQSRYNKDAGGLTTLSACMNVDISDSGRVSRRRAITRKITDSAHSLFPVDNKYCLFISDGSLCLLLPSLTEYEVVTAVTAGLKLSCFVLDGVAYWSNGVQQGKIVDGSYAQWVKSANVISNNVTRAFYDPPRGQFLGYYNGRAYIADSNVVWYSEEYAPDVFALGDSFLSFESSVSMVRPVAGGIYISEVGEAGEAGKTWFLAGTNPAEFVWKVVDDHAVLPYSDKSAVGMMSEGRWISGGKVEVAFWLTKEGIMFGDAVGQIQNISEQKIDLIDSEFSQGAILVDGSILIAQYI